jgi:hypothetical protein
MTSSSSAMSDREFIPQPILIYLSQFIIMITNLTLCLRHLACYYAGNWLLGGKLLQNQTIIDIALQLNDGCWVSRPTILIL